MPGTVRDLTQPPPSHPVGYLALATEVLGPGTTYPAVAEIGAAGRTASRTSPEWWGTIPSEPSTRQYQGIPDRMVGHGRDLSKALRVSRSVCAGDCQSESECAQAEGSLLKVGDLARLASGF
jgi:hypothetical protein